MKSNQLKLIIYFLIFMLIIFTLNTGFYLYSLHIGLDGFNTKLFGGGSDGSLYAQEAVKFAENRPYIYTSIHTPILGCILKIFGTGNLFILKVFNQIGNVLLALVTMYLTYLLTEKVEYRKQYLIILLNLIYPSLLILSTTSIYRDNWILVFYILGLCWLIKYIKTHSLIYNVLFLVNLIPLFLYRDYAILPLLVVYVLYFLKKIMNLKIILTLLFVMLNLCFVFIKDYKFPIFNMSISDALLFRQTGMETLNGGSQLNINLAKDDLFHFYIDYFYSFVSSVFGPFIWQAKSVAMLVLMCAESIPFLIIFIYLMRNIKSMSTSEIIIIVASFILFLEISLINDNLGTATRVRILGWLPLIVLAISKMGEKRHENSV
ncbi:hypothetical protein [Mammaliicoccus lentus]|uniref:hypothetical protein n=1 Tax=Mammaliicoccus lentus TaxID=42858 RepID=UPI002DB720A8|nr:hypothetical protein [Mammaliicoccus lentus]MEB5685933.1 hypothetical protein [Mammaliicoccus lentus]